MVKEQKLNELIAAFRIEMDSNESKKINLINNIIEKNKEYDIDWICYLQEKELMTFRNLRITPYMQDSSYKVSIRTYFSRNIKKLERIYQLDDWNFLPEAIKRHDNEVILSEINTKDISSFISLSNYKISIYDIKIIGERILKEQIQCGEEKTELIEEIKRAIVSKATDEKDAETYQKFATIFETIANYETYKKQQEQESKNKCLEKVFIEEF